jgi:hypothetical protein
MTRKNTAEVRRFAERFDYDPQSGLLIWKPVLVSSRHEKSWNTRFAGKPAGSIDSDGYVTVRIFGRQWKVHRVAWTLVYGDWPFEELDHINGNKGDNRLANLRPASKKENRQNLPLQKNNTSGFMGVHRYHSWKRWRARIGTDGEKHNLGFFDSPEEAYQAYLAAKAKLHKYDASGRI